MASGNSSIKRKTSDELLSNDDILSPDDALGPFSLPGKCIKRRKEKIHAGVDVRGMLSTPSSTQSEDEVKKKKIIFQKNAQSSDMTGPEVLFFWDLDYIPQPKPVDLTNASVVKILQAIFKFVAENDPNLSASGDSEWTWNNKTMTEIYNDCQSEVEWLPWMIKNDTLNFKTCTDQDWLEFKQNLHRQFSVSGVRCMGRMIHVIQLIKLIQTQFSEDGCADHEEMKDLFRILAMLIPPASELKYNGRAKYNLNYYINDQLATDNSKIFEARGSSVTVKPDGIFLVNKEFFEPCMEKIVVEVYSPESGSPRYASEKELANYSKSEGYQAGKPVRKTDAILSKAYKKAAFSYLRKSIPTDCTAYHCACKMTGQHVLQLLGSACTRSLLRNDSPTSKVEQAVGLFMKNEYLFFTKLLISNKKKNSYGFAIDDKLPANNPKDKKDQKGEVCYSNWRIDLTQANHRVALLVFLLEYLYLED